MCNSAKAVGDPRWPPLVAAACARALRKRRRSQQASRRQAERAEESVLLQGHAAQHLFVITCPLHCETMWVRTRYNYTTSRWRPWRLRGMARVRSITSGSHRASQAARRSVRLASPRSVRLCTTDSCVWHRLPITALADASGHAQRVSAPDTMTFARSSGNTRSPIDPKNLKGSSCPIDHQASLLSVRTNTFQ